jgi:hypothetical protein
VDECEKGISPKSRVNGSKADMLRRVFAEAGAGATDFSPQGGSTLLENPTIYGEDDIKEDMSSSPKDGAQSPTFSNRVY